MLKKFIQWNQINEERALRTLPTDEEYWKRKESLVKMLPYIHMMIWMESSVQSR